MSDKKYRYKFRSTKRSSAKYGPCTVCGEHASEVFSQCEERWYRDDPVETADQIENKARDAADDPFFYHCDMGEVGWTLRCCGHWFGHKECLESVRKPGSEVVPYG